MLDTAKNVAMWAIVGSWKSTSEEAIGVAQGLIPLNLRRKLLTSNYWMRVAQEQGCTGLPASSENQNKWGGIPVVGMQTPSAWSAAKERSTDEKIATGMVN